MFFLKVYSGFFLGLQGYLILLDLSALTCDARDYVYILLYIYPVRVLYVVMFDMPGKMQLQHLHLQGILHTPRDDNAHNYSSYAAHVTSQDFLG